MTDITLSMIKELRDRTGVGMSKCKEALVASNGDIEDAIAYLRKAGMAAAAKKEGRATKEGLIGFVVSDDVVAFVEVNAETDFVVKNDGFQEFISNIADEVAMTCPDSLEAFMEQKYSKDSSMTIDNYRASIVQSIGENVQIKRIYFVKKSTNTSIGVYSHMKGKLVTAVELEGSEGEEAMAKDIAMHVAAEAPEYLAEADVPEAAKLREEDIAREQVKGKPETIIEKIIAGKMNSFYDRECLLRQAFVKDPSLTIANLIEQRSKEVGKSVIVKRFLRWTVG